MSSVKALPIGHVSSPMYVVMDSSHGIKKNTHWTPHHEAANAQYAKRPPHPQLPGGSSHHSPPLTGTRGYPYPQDPTGGRSAVSVASTYATSVVANSSPHHMPPHPPGGGAGPLFTTNHLYRDAHFQVDSRPQPSQQQQQQQQQQHPEVRPIEHRYMEQQQHVRRRLNLRPTPEYVAGIERERYMEAIRYQYEREVALGGPFANAGVPRGMKPFVVSVHTPSEADISQPGKRPRLAAEPKAPVHQPLVIDTRNIVIKKEPAYNPQVEAISPTLPPEEGRCESPMKVLKENILGNINRLDKEIDQVESQVSKLQKKLHDLEVEASKPAVVKEAAKDVSHIVSKQMSIAQIIYSENRSKAVDSHAILGKLGPKVEMPLYNQPSDTAVYHENKRKYMTFKSKLINFFRKRHRERESRENYLTDTYSKLTQEWLKKMEKRDSNPSKKVKDIKTREFFEKQFPELKKQREDKERMTRVGQRIRSDAEWEEIIDGLQEQELEEKKMRSYAVIPPILLDSRQRKLRYINRNGLIEDLSQEYKEKQMLNIWTDQEKEIFREKYLQHPKNFCLIASCLDRKTVTECVQYYYLTKKSENYKQLLRKHSVRKRTRAMVKPQQQSQQQQQGSQATGMTTRQQQEEAKAMSSVPTSLPISADAIMTTPMDSSTNVMVSSSSTTSVIPDIVNGNSSGMPSIANVSLTSPDPCMSSSGKMEPKMPVLGNDKDIVLLPNNLRKKKEAAKKADGLDKTASDSDTASDHRNENGPPPPCAVCKLELDNLNQSRPLTKSNCSMYGIKDSDLIGDMRVCASCRFKSVRKRCPIPTCKTPKRKVKRLRPLPGKLSELTKELKDSIILEFQIPPEVNKCCSACFNRIIRKLETNDGTSEPAENSRWNDEETEAFKKGLGQFGTDWETLATSIGTKNKEQCRNFYFNYKRKLGLDQILKEKHKADGVKDGEQQDDKPPPIVTDEEESGETTSSCEEDNCVDRCSSDTASAPSPAEKIIEEDKSSSSRAAPFLPAVNPAPLLNAEEQRSQPLTSMDTNPPCSADYDSSATVSADEGQNQNDGELRDSSPRIIQSSNHHGPKLAIANDMARKTYNPPILKEMESRAEVGVPLVKTLLQDPNIGAGHSELTRPSYLDQPPVKVNKEEPTCVRDLIYQAIEMSLQWPAKPGRNSSPIPGNMSKDSPEIIHVEPKKEFAESSGVNIPPVAHCGSRRPSRPGSQHTEINVVDCEVQDLSKKSKSRDSSPPREYLKRERVVTPARPPSESSSSSSHGHYYGAPPPAHCNQYRSSQPPPALSPHYVGEPHHDPYYPRGSEPRNKAYAMTERPHSQPPHLVAQAASTVASTTSLSSYPKTIVAKSSVPPPPPLIASKPTQLSPKLPYKDRLISVPTGSITQGTPVNQQSPGTPVNIPSARLEGFLRQLPPPQVKDSGSITLGTPVQHEQVRRIPSGRSEVGHIAPGVYDPAVVEYFRHVSPVTQPYPFPPGVAVPSGYPPNPVPPRPPYANESQLSSKQIMIDFNTSKQMQLRRGITGDKEIKVSPRGSESSPAPASETQLHPMYPPVNYQGASGPPYVNHQGNYPPPGDSRFPHHRPSVGPMDRNHSPSGTESPVNSSFTHPGKRSPGLTQGANRQNVIHRSITWGTGKPSVIQAPQSSSPRTGDGRSEASSPAMMRKSTPSPRHPQPLIYQPVPPSGHDAFNTLVNAAVAQPSLVVPKDGKGSPASRQETKSPRDRPVVEGLEKTLIDMHQRPRSYMESTHNNNVPHNDNGRSNGDHTAPENQRHLLGVAPENRRYLNALPHAGYDMSRESPRHLERQVLIGDHHSSSLRLSNMREPFSREQFERQMRQPEVAESRVRDRPYIEKDHDRGKLVLADSHGSNYVNPQQSELDNEASKIFSQSFQKDIPRSGSSFTAANLIDAIITRQINQNAEPATVNKAPSSDLFNQYHSSYDDSKMQQRPPSTKVNTRAEVVTIDDESDTGKSTPSWNERPNSHGRSPPVQINAAPSILPVMPVPYTTEKVVTLGEHIAAIISKDYNSPTDIHQSPPFYSNSQLTSSGSRNSPFTSSTAPGNKQLEGIAAALPTDSLLTSPGVPRDSPDHSPQNCPGNGCVYHTHSWKLRRALQQDKEREHRSPALTDNSPHPRPVPSQVVGSPVNQDERQIIRVSQTTSPSVQSTVRSSPVTPYAVEPISPPTHPSDGMNMVESSNRNRMNPKGSDTEIPHSQSQAWTSNPSITGLLTTRHLYPQEYSEGSGLPPSASHFPGAPPSQSNGGSNRPPHHQQQQMGLSPLDYVKNRIVEVMRTATDDNPESHETRRLHPGHTDERDHHQMQQQQHLYKFQQQAPDREVASERPCSTGSGIPQLASQRYSPAVSRYSPVPPRPSSAAERVPSRNSTPGEQLQRNHHKRSLEGHHGLQEWRDNHRPGISSRSPPDPQLDSPLPRKKMRSDSTFIPENTIDHAPVLLPENSSSIHRVPHTEAPRLSAGGQPHLENRSSVKSSASNSSGMSSQAECFVQSGQPTTDGQDFRHSSELRSEAQWEVISSRDRLMDNNRLHSVSTASSSVAETTSPVARDSVNAPKPMDTSRSDNDNCPVSSSNAGLIPEPNRSSPGGNTQRQTPNNSSHFPPYSTSNSGVNCNNTTSSLPPPSTNQHLSYSSFPSLSTTYAYPYSALSMRSLTTTSSSHNSTPVTNSTVSGTPHPSPIPIGNSTRNSPSPLARNNSSSNSNQPPPLLSSQYEPLSDED